MHESLLVLVGVLSGTAFTCIGCVLGAYLVKRTYEEVTHPQPIYTNTNKEVEKDQPAENEAYDWDEYDNYLQPPLDDNGGEPEA